MVVTVNQLWSPSLASLYKGLFSFAYHRVYVDLILAMCSTIYTNVSISLAQPVRFLRISLHSESIMEA